MVTGLRAARARLGEVVGRAGKRAEEVKGALKTLLDRAERATEALELEIALRTERAAVVLYSIVV